MVTKPELLTTAGSLAEVAAMIRAGADAVMIGEAKYGLRLAGEFKPEQIREAVREAHAHGAKIVAAVNNIMSNNVLNELPAYLAQLADAGVDAIQFGDPAVLTAAKQTAPNVKLHWNAEMTSTNYATAKFWGRRGASRVVLARELNMEQVLEAKSQLPDMEVQVQVHGMTNIYHSKRNLVGSYMEHRGAGEAGGASANRGMDRGLFLIEAERQDEKYPVFEDENGTHIMSSEDLCMLENLHELMEGGIDSFKIEGLLKSTVYNETAVRAYRQAIDAYAADPAGYRFDPAWLAAIEKLQDPERELSYGFFYKEQVY
ncbi:peptidase U32 family protein [Paenibacillus sp. MSJ-34]|uniref:peptidase U32 family protein n=1 Tax=Paenibacillus sp. MSJ-34 TaxID=2841529 RepID=UPI001C1237F2|nr:peptidase U32 family protein [Paenibacillus sp. MSJ-34]MBU5442602.1 U32 family peptidase [Paenibacillus sp. MSJ-34]